jgi:hypothetical protein
MGSNSLAIVLMVLRWRVRILSLARVACSKEPDMQTSHAGGRASVWGTHATE